MNSEVKRVLDLYLNSCYLYKEIEAFAKFYEEGPGSTNHEPSLSHIISLIEELNKTRVPDLVMKLENDRLSSSLKEINKTLSGHAEAIVNIEDKSHEAMAAKRRETDAMLELVRKKREAEMVEREPEVEDLSNQDAAALEMDQIESAQHKDEAKTADDLQTDEIETEVVE